MELLIVLLGFLGILVGIAGSILPVLPGPPVAWASLILLKLTGLASLSAKLLWITAVITLALVVMDYWLPSISTRKYGGSKAAQRGAFIGTLLGLLFGPWGILLGPLVGAFLGEIFQKPKGIKKAVKVALASFVGFLMNTGLKLIWCVLLGWWYMRAVFN